MEQNKLTARQQQILTLIETAIRQTGAPPTRAEIAKELGFKSANAAEEHLQAWPAKVIYNLSAEPLGAFASKAQTMPTHSVLPATPIRCLCPV